MEFSFAPDRRSIQANVYHFSYRPSGQPSQRQYSQYDSLVGRLDQIYRENFESISRNIRDNLINILVTQMPPLTHRNLEMLAIANFIIYHMDVQNIQFTPESFGRYFDHFESKLMPDVRKKTPDEINIIRAKLKATLLRYIYYIQRHLESQRQARIQIMPQPETQVQIMPQPETQVQIMPQPETQL